jgi:hypothetical protein
MKHEWDRMWHTWSSNHQQIMSKESQTFEIDAHGSTRINSANAINKMQALIETSTAKSVLHPQLVKLPRRFSKEQ